MTPKNDATIDLGIALSMPAPTEVTQPQHDELSRWIGLAASGDLSAFESVIRRFERQVLLTCQRLLGNVDDAQDAAQETFIRVFKNLSRVDRNRRFEPWLYRIAVNVCRDAWKRRKRHAAVPLPHAGEPPDLGRRGDPHRALRAREDQGMLYDALLMVRAPEELMPAIEQAVRRFDVPSRAAPSVELTTFILVATNDGRQQALPAHLDPVVEQLRGVLPYRVFNSLDSAIARGVDQEVIQLQGVMPQIPGAAPGNPNYFLRAGLVVTSGSDDRRIVRLDNFQFNTNIQLSDRSHDVSIGTSIDITEGQHAVVGKASVGASALILVMSARIID